MTILIKAAKNMQLFHQRKSIDIFPSTDLATCPVARLRMVITDNPTISNQQPMFVFKAITRPIPASYVAVQWRIYNSGLSERHVQQYGPWASKAYKTYRKRKEDHQVARVSPYLFTTPHKLKIDLALAAWHSFYVHSIIYIFIIIILICYSDLLSSK